MNIVDYGEAKAGSSNAETKMRRKCLSLLLVLLSVAMGASGCADPYYYGGGPYHGGGPYYGGRQYYGGGPYYNRPYRPYYGGPYYGTRPYYRGY